MQRVRIGLTGLAFVFVLVLLAWVFTKASQEEPITANTIEQQRAGARPGGPGAANEAQPKEPLAELGVAPGNADDNGSASAVPPPAPANAAPPPP
jgi:hypothetical protein